MGGGAANRAVFRVEFWGPLRSYGLSRPPRQLHLLRKGLIGALRLCLFLLMLLIPKHIIYGQRTIEIRGFYSGSVYRKSTATYEKYGLKVGFLYSSSGDTWRISATNANESTSWEELVYDGTNTYTMMPYEGHFSVAQPESNLVFTTISRSSLYLAAVSDDLQLYIPWLAYGLSPQMLASNKTATLAIPLPWYVPRVSPSAYGYRWIATPSSDGRFLESCQVVRDTSLDLSYRQELLRPELDWPLTEMDRDRCVELLGIRKTVPNGFVDTRYDCLAWYRTNGVTFPAEAEVKFYRYGQRFSCPSYIVELKTTKVKVCDDAKEVLTSPNAPYFVNDYRYRMTNSARIFRFAAYTLRPGDAWKTDHDPGLSAVAEYYLHHGPRYDRYALLGSYSRLSRFAWSLVGLQVFGVVLIWKMVVKQTKGKIDKHNTKAKG